MSKLLILFVVIVSVSIGIHSEPDNDSPGFLTTLQGLIREIDQLSYTTKDENEKERWGIFLETFKTDLQKFATIAKDEMNTMKQKLREGFQSLKSRTQELVQDTLKKNIEREASHLQQTKELWKQMWLRFHSTASTAIGVAKRRLIPPLKDAREAVRHANKFPKGDNLPELAGEFQKELKSVHQTYVSELEALYNRYEHLLQKIEQDTKLEEVQSPILRCCGIDYSFEDFLNHFDHNLILALSAEEDWSGGDQEMFQKSWAAWVNHMKLPCPTDCSDSQWEDVHPTEPKDEL